MAPNFFLLLSSPPLSRRVSVGVEGGAAGAGGGEFYETPCVVLREESGEKFSSLRYPRFSSDGGFSLSL